MTGNSIFTLSFRSHFHAAGHLAYAKSAHFYIQQMLELPHKMPVEEYKLFTEKEYFTIRRTDKFWDGIFSDQTIEQFLMRQLKSSGGITHGRGITESTLTKWVHALPRCVPICNALERYTSVHSGTSEQHKDLRPASKLKDNTDLSRFTQWLEAYPPFVLDLGLLVNIATGIVADSSVNCDNAVQIGQSAMIKMTGKTYANITLHCKEKVKPFSAMKNTINVRGEKVVFNPSILFNRITCILSTSSELDTFLHRNWLYNPHHCFWMASCEKQPKVYWER